MTGLPGWKRCTAGPTATTKPAFSCPGMNQGVRLESGALPFDAVEIRAAHTSTVDRHDYLVRCADRWVRHVLPERARCSFERRVISVQTRSAHQLYRSSRSTRVPVRS